MWCLFKQKELNDVVIDIEILAIGEKEHCINKAYDDYDFWKEYSIEDIEKKLECNKLQKFRDPEWEVYKLREV